MKVFQIVDDFCFWQTPYSSLAETVGRYPPDIIFAEAPDTVFEGWGYLDGQFIQPEPPEGWLYDVPTGTFYKDGDEPPAVPEPAAYEPTAADDIDAIMVDHEYRLVLLELGVN